MHGATEQTGTPRVLVVEDPPTFACTRRWAASNPNEKQVPNAPNQAGGGAVAMGNLVGG